MTTARATGVPVRGDLGWQLDAACLPEDVNPLWFDPADGAGTGHGKTHDLQVTLAKSICRRCPVQAECLTDALATEDEFTVRAGLTPDERKALLERGGRHDSPAHRSGRTRAGRTRSAAHSQA